MRNAQGGWLVAVAIGVTVLAGCSTDEPSDGAAVERGAELYQRNCAACHGGATGGAIGDIPPRHNAEGHTWHHPDCELVDVTLRGLPPRDGYPVMPAFAGELSEEDAYAILAHIRTWWEPEQRDHQAAVTERVCG